MVYVLVVEAQLESERLALVESTLCSQKVDVPESEVVVGQQHLHVRVVLLDGFVFLLQPLAHAQSHLIFILILY